MVGEHPFALKTILVILYFQDYDEIQQKNETGELRHIFENFTVS